MNAPLKRTRINVTMDGDKYVAVWDGREVRSRNPFGLDSQLTDIGVPIPRDLYLIEQGDPKPDPVSEMFPGTLAALDALTIRKATP